MSTSPKQRQHQASPKSLSQLFVDLHDMLSKSEQGLSTQEVSAFLAESLRQLGNNVRRSELIALRDVTRALANEIDELLLAEERQVLPATHNLDELERAHHEDIVLEQVLASARRRVGTPMSTPESIRRGEELIAQAKQNAAATTAARIASRELISAMDLQQALGVTHHAVNIAVKAQRIFAIVGPSGKNYYPAFYADPTLDRQSVEHVSAALGSLPGPSKLYFFTSRFTSLQETPLDALRKGRKAEVLAAAVGFAQR